MSKKYRISFRATPEERQELDAISLLESTSNSALTRRAVLQLLRDKSKEPLDLDIDLGECHE